ncbi:MAG: DUF4280 domain-containing protein [Oscillospiraceae bacterium]|nr:DUF4280 domain-containing protein [Oscillospiraceae bacterium]
MGILVCGGACIACSFGASPSVLNIPPEDGVMGQAPMACVEDNVAITNIPPFGMCSSLGNPQVASATSAALGVLTPQPCMPSLEAFWKPAAEGVLIGQVPAIDMSSQLICSYGGIIKIISPVQTNLMAN